MYQNRGKVRFSVSDLIQNYDYTTSELEEEVIEDEKKKIQKYTLLKEWAKTSVKMELRIFDSLENQVETFKIPLAGQAKQETKILHRESQGIVADILQSMLSAIFENPEEEKKKRILKLKNNSINNMVQQVSDQIVKTVASSKILYIPTKIIEVNGIDIFINKGKKWGIHIGDEFFYEKGKESESYLKIKSSEEYYSVGSLIWGTVNKDIIIEDSGIKGVLLRLDFGFNTFFEPARLEQFARNFLVAEPTPTRQSQRVGISTSLLLAQEFAFRYYLGIHLGLFSSKQFSYGVEIGRNLFGGKFRLTPALVFCGGFLNQNLPFYSEPPLQSQNSFEMQTDVNDWYLRSSITISYHVTNRFLLNLTLGYNLNLTQNLLNVEISEYKLDGSKVGILVDKAFPNTFYSFSGWQINLGFTFRG